MCCPCQHRTGQAETGLQSCQAITFHQILLQDLQPPPARPCPYPKCSLPAFAGPGLGLSPTPGWVGFPLAKASDRVGGDISTVVLPLPSSPSPRSCRALGSWRGVGVGILGKGSVVRGPLTPEGHQCHQQARPCALAGGEAQFG